MYSLNSVIKTPLSQGGVVLLKSPEASLPVPVDCAAAGRLQRSRKLEKMQEKMRRRTEESSLSEPVAVDFVWWLEVYSVAPDLNSAAHA